MSLKWQRVKAWDEAFFPAWAWPAKALLRALSSIWLAVILLSGVVVYGILASVPIGMLALLPTWLVYAGLFVAGVGGITIAALAPTLAITRPLTRAPRFLILLGIGVLAAGVAAWAWLRFAWPMLEYHAPTGDGEATGFRLFAGFAERYQSTTLRRLPGIEMTELEFYSALPMRVLLLVFVLNMVVATIRRIAFEFVNIGVLTVHTGIVLIALGSVYYAGQKREGDTLLQAGPTTEQGDPTPGPPVGFFYDNVQTVLVVDQWRGPEQRRLAGVPRYNDYNVADIDFGAGAATGAGRSVWAELGRAFEAAAPNGGHLSIEVESWRGQQAGRTPLVDPDINFRVVGYASYAERETDWVRADPLASGALTAGTLNPLRLVDLAAVLPETPEQSTRVPFFFMPRLPAHRIAETPAFGIEYRIAEVGQSGNPADDPTLEAAMPQPGPYALWVRVPGRNEGQIGGQGNAATAEPQVWTIAPGQVYEIEGFRLEITDVSPEPPFPIVTEGYRGSTSAVAQVRVVPPAGLAESGGDTTPYTRWVYARFPEINQDLVEQTETELNEASAAGAGPMSGPMSGRRDADPSIDIRLIDASKLQVTIVEAAPANAPPGVAPTPAPGGRVVIRQRGGALRAFDVPNLRDPFEIVQAVTLEITDRWAHAEPFERPVPVPPMQQNREMIGTHQRAMLAVEVSLANRSDWRTVVWLPFAQYLEIGTDLARTVRLPDGRQVRLVFGRRQHRLPGFQVRLVDFQMLAYDHRGAPRDYQSIVRVEPIVDERGRAAFDSFEHITKLNAPLTAPFNTHADHGLVAGLVGRIAAGLDPDQYKFSQAGWDAEGWRESQTLADQGLLPRPRARFTILQVGNYAGIHVIALGGILMALGIPWAFYVKPWLMRRKRDALAAAARESTTEARRHGGGA